MVRGVDYLLIGKITDMRAKTVRKDRGFGIGNLGLKKLGRISSAIDYSREDIEIQAECGVDLRLVDPTSGSVKAAHFGSYTLQDNASSVGLELAGFGSKAAADLELTDDDRGKVMRLALDNAMRKMLPEVDAHLRTLSPEAPNKARSRTSGYPKEPAAKSALNPSPMKQSPIRSLSLMLTCAVIGGPLLFALAPQKRRDRQGGRAL